MLTDPNQRATTVKNQDITKINVDSSKNSENKLKIIKIILETKTVSPIPLTRTATSTILTTIAKTVAEQKESQKLFIHPVRHVGRQTTPPLHIGMLLWSQCSHETASAAQKTGKTESCPKESQPK